MNTSNIYIGSRLFFSFSTTNLKKKIEKSGLGKRIDRTEPTVPNVQTAENIKYEKYNCQGYVIVYNV